MGREFQTEVRRVLGHDPEDGRGAELGVPIADDPKTTIFTAGGSRTTYWGVYVRMSCKIVVFVSHFQQCCPNSEKIVGFCPSAIGTPCWTPSRPSTPGGPTGRPSTTS